MSISDSRERILERIRVVWRGGRSSAAQAEQNGHGGPAREYQTRGKLTAEARKKLFIERLREYDAEVVECAPEELEETIARQLDASGRHLFVVPTGLPKEWLAPGRSKFEWKIDHDLAAGEIEKAEGVVTACFCGVADSGTIVLHHSATEGRRVITLLPDWHWCVVRTSQIVETLPEYFDRCQGSGVRGREDEGQVTGNGRAESREQGTGNRETRNERAGKQGEGTLPRLVTWVSGPSATADIEMTRIKGVHGPRFLHVILVRDEEDRV